LLRASPRRRANLIDRSLERLEIGLVEIGLRDLLHRIRGGPRRAEIVGGITRHADLVLRIAIEAFEIVIGDRPVDALPVERLQPEILRQEP